MFPFDEQVCILEMLDFKFRGTNETRLVTTERKVGDGLSSFVPTVQDYEYEFPMRSSSY